MKFTAWLLETTKYNKDADKDDGVYKFARVVDSDMHWPFPESLDAMQTYLDKAKDKEGSVWHGHEGLAFVSRIAWDDYQKAKVNVSA